MSTHPDAGKPAPKDILIDVSRLESAFYEGKTDPTAGRHRRQRLASKPRERAAARR
jgi:hypothetical protein